MVSAGASASAFALSFLVKLVCSLRAHGVVATSGFVSTGAWVETLFLTSIQRLVRVLCMAHEISLALRSLQRNLLIIYNSRCPRKRCHWSSINHTWIYSNGAQSLNSIYFILTSSPGLRRSLKLITLLLSLPFPTTSSISSILALEPLWRKYILLLQQLLLRQLLTTLILKDILRNRPYKPT